MTVAVFVAPYLLEATVRFVDAAARLPGVRLALVTHEPADRLPTELRESVVAHWRVDDALDASQLTWAVRGLADQLGGVDRLMGALEQLQVPLGEVRDALGIPGMGAATAHNFRDKARMKEVLRAAGVPCARHRLARSAGDAWDFAGEVGFPLVVKPPAGFGARSTFRLDEPDALRAWLEAAVPTPADPALVEEFLVGEERSFDSITVDGELRWYSVAHYLPTPLEVLRTPWVQWAVLLPRDVGGPEYDGIRAAGPAALRALGVETGLTHMEWFRRPDGSVAVSEVAARPPGAQITAMLGHVHDVDFPRVWAQLMLLGTLPALERRWAAGTAFLRGQGVADGRVVAVRGLDDLQSELGPLVVEARLPQPGQSPTGTYEGEGYVIVRHPETAVVVDALRRLVSGLRVELG